ncbi:unnamed protein product [Urochloa humidicola]
MSNFNDEQKNAITTVGFGSLLKLKELEIRRELCKEIADSFDMASEQFNIGGYNLTLCIEDVNNILDLPSQGDEIKHPPRRQVPNLFDKTKGTDSSKITSSDLKNYLKNDGSYGDEFIRKFVLYTIGFYLCPTLQPYVKSDYLSLVEDVNNIKNINWSSLVLNDLIASIKEYKGVKAANLKGNLALLQVWYWEKVSISHIYPTLHHPGREKPLMQYWDENRAKERCRLARKHRFGEGEIVHDIASPKQSTPTQSNTTTQDSNEEDSRISNEQMQELKLLITNLGTSIITIMQAGFDAMNKRIDSLAEEQQKLRQMEPSRTAVLETSPTKKVPDTNNKVDMSEAKQQAERRPDTNNKVDMSEAKQQAERRPGSKRQPKPKTNTDFEYASTKKRRRSNKAKQTEENIPQVYEPAPNESTSDGTYGMS